MRNILLEIIVHSRFRNLNTARPVERSEELAAVRVSDTLSIHIHCIIMETRHKRICSNLPDSVFSLGHLIVLSAHIDCNRLCIRHVIAEDSAEVRIDLRILRSREVGCCACRFCKNADLCIVCT